MYTREMERNRKAAEDMGMTLEKWFEGLDKNAFVKIATKDGTRFILAGRCDRVLEKMTKLDEAYKEKARKAMELAKEKYLDAISREVDSTYGPKKRKTYESHVRGLGTAFLKTVVAYEKFKPLKERKVTDDFVAAPCIDDVDDPVYVAYIEGNEVGMYEKINENGEGDVMRTGK